ncbi:MAG: hypothetical protein AAFZ17_23225 [Cyanobacteria bacterium J06650_10]
MKFINRFQNLLNKTGLTSKFANSNIQSKSTSKNPIEMEVAGRPPRRRVNQGRFPGRNA